MAAKDVLRAALIAKLKVSPRTLDRRLADRENDRLLPRRLAMLSLARDAGMTLRKYASDDELAALRGQDRVESTAPATVPDAAQPKLASIKPPRRKPGAKPAAARDKVFVVHGRDMAKRNAMFDFLRSVRLDPMEWGKALGATGKAQPSIPETLDAAFSEVSAVVVLLTPDDAAKLKSRFYRSGDPDYEKTLTGQARPNVLFEAGMAFGRHPEATVLVTVGRVKPFTDISGLHITRLDNQPESRAEFVEKLKRAGCAVDVEGRTDWFTKGDFEEDEDGD